MDEITVAVIRTDPPWHLTKGTLIAQAFLAPTWADVWPENPLVFWAEMLSQDRPLTECGMSNKGIKVSLPDVADTGTDATITAHSKWPLGWEFVPANGVISGIGGAATSMCCKRSILFKGPEGQIDTARPFVAKAPVIFWGTDLLSQWGARLEIPSHPQDF